jgi:hypothetical protein
MTIKELMMSNTKTLRYVRPAVALLAGVASCRESQATAATTVRHPREEFRRSPATTVTAGSLDLGDTVVRASGTRWLATSPTLRLGVRDGPVEQTFGKIQDVAVDSRHRLYLLDARANEIRVFNQHGTYEHTLRSPDSDSLRWRSPKAIAIGPRDRLYIADAPGRLHILDRARERYRHVVTVSVGIDVAGLCAMGDTLYAQGSRMDDSLVIHRFDRDGQALGSFGTVYRSSNRLINYQIARGVIACVAPSRAVVYAPSGLLGELRSFAPSGSLRWYTRLSGFRPVVYDEFPNGASVTIPPDGHTYIIGLKYVPPGHLLLQVATQTRDARANGRDYATVRSYVVDAASGNGQFLSDSLPPALGSDGRDMVLVDRDPFSVVTVRRLAPMQPIALSFP